MAKVVSPGTSRPTSGRQPRPALAPIIQQAAVEPHFGAVHERLEGRANDLGDLRASPGVHVV